MKNINTSTVGVRSRKKYRRVSNTRKQRKSRRQRRLKERSRTRKTNRGKNLNITRKKHNRRKQRTQKRGGSFISNMNKKRKENKKEKRCQMLIEKIKAFDFINHWNKTLLDPRYQWMNLDQEFFSKYTINEGITMGKFIEKTTDLEKVINNYFEGAKTK